MKRRVGLVLITENPTKLRMGNQEFAEYGLGASY